METQFPHMWNGGKNACFTGSLWGPNEIKFSPLLNVWDPRVYGEWCPSKAPRKNRVNLVAGVSRQFHLGCKESGRLTQGGDERRKGAPAGVLGTDLGIPEPPPVPLSSLPPSVPSDSWGRRVNAPSLHGCSVGKVCVHSGCVCCGTKSRRSYLSHPSDAHGRCHRPVSTVPHSVFRAGFLILFSIMPS